MPAAVAVPLITAGVGAGTTIAAAKIGSNAAKDAGKIQAQSADRARQLEQSIYNDQRQMYAPWIQGGLSAFQSLTNRYGGQPMLSSMANPNVRVGTASSQKAGLPLTDMASAEPMIALRAPTGEVQRVPRARAQFFIDRGAVPLNAARGGMRLADMAA